MSKCVYTAGRKVAVDASMSLYQFMIAVRVEGSQLTDSEGDTTRYICTYVGTRGGVLDQYGQYVSTVY